MIRVLISSCLLGEAVRYDGGHLRYEDPILETWRREGRLVPFCPEVEGGLPVPRPPCEIVGGDATEVLSGRAIVHDISGRDLTGCFLAGAEGALERARRSNARLAILAEGSPSCGSSWIYDGTFSGTRRKGRGVTSTLLAASGIRVFSQHQIEAAAEYLNSVERDRS